MEPQRTEPTPAEGTSQSRRILGMRVDAPDYRSGTAQILSWAQAGESRYVCVSNVHMVMEAHDSPEFRAMINRSDLVTPDGMPLVWALRWLGTPDASRVDGSTLTLHVCEAAARSGVPIGLYGGSDETLAAFSAFARRQFPGIKIVSAISPPFRPIASDEHAEMLAQIRDSGARIVFVALGCPKQETWMAENYLRLTTVMIGIGAALDFHAGRIPRAPEWMQRTGLEWLFRLMMEPGRLWRRYAKHNPRFIGLFLLQLLRLRRFDAP